MNQLIGEIGLSGLLTKPSKYEEKVALNFQGFNLLNHRKFYEGLSNL
jgi:hypothetical protein